MKTMLRNIGLLALLLPTGGLVADDTELFDDLETDGEIDEEMSLSDELSAFGEVAMQTAMTAVVESGGLYPFGMVLREDGNAHMAGFEGTPEEAPPAEEWEPQLFQVLRQTAHEEDGVRGIAMLRLHEMDTEEGEQVPAVWAKLDHRESAPLILVLPLIPGEDGTHEQGELLYVGTDQGFFAEQPEAEAEQAPEQE